MHRTFMIIILAIAIIDALVVATALTADILGVLAGNLPSSLSVKA